MPTAHPAPTLMTMMDAARVLSVSKVTVIQWCDFRPPSGWPVALVTMRGQRLLPRADVEEFAKHWQPSQHVLMSKAKARAKAKPRNSLLRTKAA